MSNKKLVAIIGSGIGGMAAAIRLSRQGCDVKVYEKNSYPGGKLSHFKKEGYSFDAGPSLFTQPEQVKQLFDLCGENMEDYFTYQKVNIACKYFFESGEVVNAYADLDDFADEISDKLGEPRDSVVDYLQSSKRTYLNVGQLFLDHSMRVFNKVCLTKLLTLRYEDQENRDNRTRIV